jgi:hypothetical protein
MVIGWFLRNLPAGTQACVVFTWAKMFAEAQRLQFMQRLMEL